MDYTQRYKTFVPQQSFSQEGEDLILCKLLAAPGGRVLRGGHYVDVGCHHPVRYSNTHLLHQRFGWSGMNIDPNPGVKEVFDELRPGDVNLEMGIAGHPGTMELHLFDEPAVNTFSNSYATQVNSWNTRECLGTRMVTVDTLDHVLETHLPGVQIDVLNVDVEDMELEVLSSNDWSRHRPRLVLVEILETNLDNLPLNPVHLLLQRSGYELCAKTFSTGIYREIQGKE